MPLLSASLSNPSIRTSPTPAHTRTTYTATPHTLPESGKSKSGRYVFKLVKVGAAATPDSMFKTVKEATFLLAEYLASPQVYGSVGYPEVVVPVVGAMRRQGGTEGQREGEGEEDGHWRRS